MVVIIILRVTLCDVSTYKWILDNRKNHLDKLKKPKDFKIAKHILFIFQTFLIQFIL